MSTASGHDSVDRALLRDILRYESTQWHPALKVISWGSVSYLALLAGDRMTGYLVDQGQTESGALAPFDVTLSVGDGADILSVLAAVTIAITLTSRTVWRNGRLDPRAYARERLWHQVNEAVATTAAFVACALLGKGVTSGTWAGVVPLVLLAAVLAIIATTAVSAVSGHSPVEVRVVRARLRQEFAQYESALGAWLPERVRHGRRFRVLGHAAFVLGVSVLLTLLLYLPDIHDAGWADASPSDWAYIALGTAITAVLAAIFTILGTALVCAVVVNFVARVTPIAVVAALVLVAWTAIGLRAALHALLDASQPCAVSLTVAAWFGTVFLVFPGLCIWGLRHPRAPRSALHPFLIVQVVVLRHIYKETKRIEQRSRRLRGVPTALEERLDRARIWDERIRGARPRDDQW